MVKEHDYDIVLTSGKEIRSQSDTNFLFVHHSGEVTPTPIPHFLTLLQSINKYTHVYITSEYGKFKTAYELININAIARFVQK